MAQRELREGVAYHDGQVRTLYDPEDRASVEAAILQQRGGTCFGPLCISWSYQPPASVKIDVTLLGLEIASCNLNLSNPDCAVGGSVDGFTARVRVDLKTDPLRLVIIAELKTPITDWKRWEITIPLAVAEEATADLDGHRLPAAALV
jgi:hypothetical protein